MTAIALRRRSSSRLIERRISEQREQCNERDDGDVLEQKHRESFAPVIRSERASLGERREDERGGRHRHADAGDDRRVRRKTKPCAQRADR